MMKRQVFGLFAAFVLAGALPVWAAEVYGRGVQLERPTKVSEIFADPQRYVGDTVLVEGTVVAVCAKRGCWMDLASDQPYQKVKIKVDDGVIVFPLSARGKTARVEGVVEEIRMSRDEALARGKHLAEEQGIPFDPATITGPQTEYRIKATGAVVD